MFDLGGYNEGINLGGPNEVAILEIYSKKRARTG